MGSTLHITQGGEVSSWQVPPGGREVRLVLAGGWRYKLFYQWVHDTSNSKQTADFGAFDDNQLGLRVTHTW